MTVFTAKEKYLSGKATHELPFEKKSEVCHKNARLAAERVTHLGALELRQWFADSTKNVEIAELLESCLYSGNMDSREKKLRKLLKKEQILTRAFQQARAEFQLATTLATSSTGTELSNPLVTAARTLIQPRAELEHLRQQEHGNLSYTLESIFSAGLLDSLGRHFHYILKGVREQELDEKKVDVSLLIKRLKEVLVSFLGFVQGLSQLELPSLTDSSLNSYLGASPTVLESAYYKKLNELFMDYRITAEAGQRMESSPETVRTKQQTDLAENAPAVLTSMIQALVHPAAELEAYFMVSNFADPKLKRRVLTRNEHLIQKRVMKFMLGATVVLSPPSSLYFGLESLSDEDGIPPKTVLIGTPEGTPVPLSGETAVPPEEPRVTMIVGYNELKDLQAGSIIKRVGDDGQEHTYFVYRVVWGDNMFGILGQNPVAPDGKVWQLDYPDPQKPGEQQSTAAKVAVAAGESGIANASEIVPDQYIFLRVLEADQSSLGSGTSPAGASMPLPPETTPVSVMSMAEQDSLMKAIVGENYSKIIVPEAEKDRVNPFTLGAMYQICLTVNKDVQPNLPQLVELIKTAPQLSELQLSFIEWLVSTYGVSEGSAAGLVMGSFKLFGVESANWSSSPDAPITSWNTVQTLSAFKPKSEVAWPPRQRVREMFEPNRGRVPSATQRALA